MLMSRPQHAQDDAGNARAIEAVRQALSLVADAYDRAAGAHDELSRVQDEAARLEDETGSRDRAVDRRRAARVAGNETAVERAQAEQSRSRT
jgi:hypothetical protein